MPEYLNPEEDERQEMDQISPSALAVLNQSEHAAMVQTANLPANRRKLGEFESKLMAYANHSQPVALSMFYSLPRAGKQIIGPSVRYAEIVAPCWRNCAVAARVIGDASSTVTAQGIFLDYEANLRNAIEVPRRITDKDGRRYSDDMVITTSNAAMSVARRNAVLKGGVPQALWSPAYDAAQLTAVGKAESHAQRVANAMEYLLKLGVTEWQILNAVGVPSPKELETEHLVTLRVLCQEIKRGDKTIEEVFGSAFDKEIDSMFAQLKMNAAQQTMLRNSYLGRAAELVNYLRERLGPMRGEPVNKEPFKPSVPEGRIHVSEVATYPSGKAVEEALAPSRDGNAAYETKLTPDEVAQHSAATAAPADPRTVSGDALPPFDEPADTLPAWSRASAPAQARPQTSMEPPQKKRGRPSREEMARRSAAEQGSLIPPSEDVSRREAEETVEAMDQFAF